MKNACRHYDRFRDQWDDEVGSYPWIAVAYQRLGRLSEADSILAHGIANLEEKLDMFPSNQVLQIRLAIQYAMAGDMN